MKGKKGYNGKPEHDSPEMIARCLNCQRPKCNNCLRTDKPVGMTRTELREKLDAAFLELTKRPDFEKLNNKQIGAIIGCSGCAVADRRLRFGMPRKGGAR